MTKNEYFNSKEFEEQYHYNGELGSFCSKDGTQFLIWAPTADMVELRIYHTGDEDEIPRVEKLKKGERGVWSFQTPENLDGFYYRYDITVDGVTRRTADPYAKACGVNGHRSMVLDLARTNPEGWETDQAPELSNENIIYEVHVKDFTWDKSSGVREAFRGKYPGLIEEGTTLNQDGIHPTGIDYMKELGVTHVQLMPVYDYGSVDEDGADDQFNWGYDPINYNVPEGSYSTDPYHGEVRIRELKQVIRALHRNGFRVIMDVVYNHTYRLNSFLNRTVPDYYYRFGEDGTPSNGSGCGNDTASERSMCAKYILDSVLYWAEEYHIDGFRFDLMGLLPVELMNQIREAVDQKFGPEKIMLYGEPWSATDTSVRPGTILADKNSLRKLYPDVGAFCDSTRDAIKGSVMEEDGRGFVNGGDYDPKLHIGCILGWSGIHGAYSVNLPSQTIGYLSCHDDWTLWDRLVNTMDETHDFTGYQEEVIAANRLAIALLFGCQGNMFLLSGEEAGRTKQGIKNSFCSSIEINKIDWNRVWKMEKLKEYYKGLFALRKELPCLYDKTETARDRVCRVSLEKQNCTIIELKNAPGSAKWEMVRIIYNLGKEPQKLTLSDGIWQVLSDEADSFLWKQTRYVTDEVVAAAGSAIILGK